MDGWLDPRRSFSIRKLNADWLTRSGTRNSSFLILLLLHVVPRSPSKNKQANKQIHIGISPICAVAFIYWKMCTRELQWIPLTLPQRPCTVLPCVVHSLIFHHRRLLVLLAVFERTLLCRPCLVALHLQCQFELAFSVSLDLFPCLLGHSVLVSIWFEQWRET
jgi:hypothetical protein